MSISKIAMLTFGIMILASSALISNQAYAVCHLINTCNEVEVGGLPSPINESEVFGELAHHYALWIIPAISAIGIGAFLVKRKY